MADDMLLALVPARLGDYPRMLAAAVERLDDIALRGVVMRPEGYPLVTVRELLATAFPGTASDDQLLRDAPSADTLRRSALLLNMLHAESHNGRPHPDMAAWIRCWERFESALAESVRAILDDRDMSIREHMTALVFARSSEAQPSSGDQRDREGRDG